MAVSSPWAMGSPSPSPPANRKRLSNQISNMMDYTEIVEGTLNPAKKEYMITSIQ